MNTKIFDFLTIAHLNLNDSLVDDLHTVATMSDLVALASDSLRISLQAIYM